MTVRESVVSVLMKKEKATWEIYVEKESFKPGVKK